MDMDDKFQRAEPESLAGFGIEQVQVEHFRGGGYSDAILAHAITQAKRARRQGERR